MLEQNRSGGSAGDRDARARPGALWGAGRGARGADFAQGRGARGAGEHPPAPLLTLHRESQRHALASHAASPRSAGRVARCLHSSGHSGLKRQRRGSLGPWTLLLRVRRSDVRRRLLRVHRPCRRRGRPSCTAAKLPLCSAWWRPGSDPNELSMKQAPITRAAIAWHPPPPGRRRAHPRKAKPSIGPPRPQQESPHGQSDPRRHRREPPWP